MLGVGLLKIYFQPDADIASAIAQVNAVSETILTIMARGTEPPTDYLLQRSQRPGCATKCLQ